jgi:Uma2 family endonuclease
MTLAAPPVIPHRISSDAGETRVVLPVSWSLYERIVRELGDDSPGIRLAYDNGLLEIMSPSRLHENVKKIAARLIEAYADSRGITAKGLGSTTFKRKDLRKGLEADECYYIANASRIIGRKRLDLRRDPPPDLAIEVDLSPPGVARPPIYAALGVPEIWRYDGQRFVVLIRTPGGEYAESAISAAFPDLSIVQFNRLVKLGIRSGQSAAVTAMREWIRTKPPRK